MAETLKARVGQMIVGGIHALLNQVEDIAPEAMMAQSIREVDTLVAEVQHELGKAAANRHLAQQQHVALNQKHLELSMHIEEGIAQGRDDLAKAAVARQLDIEVQLPVVETTLANLGGQEAELKSYVDALRGKKREMETALSQFRISREKANAPSATAAHSTAAGKLENAVQSFDTVFERQTGMSSQAKHSEINDMSKLKQLEDLVRDNKIEARLAQIKAGQS
jgi:phage shock protein A